jgi:hypothetical protein
MHEAPLQPNQEGLMRLRSLILVALIGGLFFGHIRESQAITTCNVCADGIHPCVFKCYTGTLDFPFVTTCGLAGYQCIRIPSSNSAQQCDLAAPAATVPDLLAVAAGWLREGLSLLNEAVDRVAVLDTTGATAARS